MTGTYKAVSLFSGAGGMDVGFSRAGVIAQIANDIDAEACATYARNHSNPIIKGDVRHHFDAITPLRGADFVFGGPPCQGFSVAGKMNPDDERSLLIQTFMDVVDLVQPTAFVCENVKALASLAKWQFVRESLIKRASNDYSVALVLLNSQDFGVPQSRERMFLVGIHKDQLNVSREAFEANMYALLEEEHKVPPTIAEVVKRFGRAGSATNSRVCKAKISFARSPVLRKSPYAGMLFNGAGRPLYSFGQSSTLPASMGGNKTPIVDEAVIFDGQKSFVETYHSNLLRGDAPLSGTAPLTLRRLTLDECAAIQTFPKDYKFSGSQSSIYRQIGNAVPSNLANAVANAVIKTMRDGIQQDYTLIAAE